MPSVIVAQQLCKHYGPHMAVDNVSFAVEAGEVMGLLGPNGSGKTTILRMLTGYLRPSSGTAQIAGCDIVADSLAARRQVGYVPEDVPLYTHMRVNEFLGFMGRLHGLTGAALRTEIHAVCERLALREVRHTAIGKLSRGYRQRVAIAQALLHHPPLLILDEPTNGLDPRQIIEIRELIRSLAHAHTVLVTSHILSEIEKVAHRAAILLHGRLLGVHTLADNAAAPALRLTLRGPAQPQAKACLEAVPGVHSVSLDTACRERASYLVHVQHPGVSEALAAALVRQGFGVLALHPVRADLETLFLRLTGSQGTV